MKLAPHYDIDGDDYITFDEYSKRAIGEDIEGKITMPHSSSF